MANGASLPTPNPLDRILSSHIKAFTYFIQGTADYGQAFYATQYTDASDYANKFGNVDTTNGYAAKFQYGPAASPTEIATFAKAVITFTSLLKLSGGSLDVSQQSAPGAPGTSITRLYADTGGNDGLLHVRAGASGSARRILDGGFGTAAGDTIFWTASNTPTRLAIGTARQNLAVNAGATGLAYQNSLQSLMTTTGDIVYAASANTPTRLAIGTAGQVPMVSTGATALAYTNVTQRTAAAFGSTDPTTTSASAVAIADPTRTLTTTGGDVFVWARMTINCSVAAVVNLYVRESIANTFVLIADVSPPSSSGRQTVSGFYLFTGLAATAHTFDLGMATSAGTVQSFGSSRSIMALEVRS